MGLEDFRKSRSKPPTEWFTALGYQDRGILTVSVNENFTNLSGGKVGRHYDAWCHYTGNPVTPDDPPERVEQAREAIAEAKSFITQVTGFSPREVLDMALKFSKQYRGNKSSPLKTELF